ncbi:hypothetical protein DF3PB_710012 [uncultured Defluviicoccus sp.]|uniref:Uncharacterized protein n=1 Tax=metagenome TaxID=256318 RepID=A0A380TJA0_9ZZZZ|nr:hypothetical protein DF3PB_710012 [uncultured Defluviicoccus sp.]
MSIVGGLIAAGPYVSAEGAQNAGEGSTLIALKLR